MGWFLIALKKYVDFSGRARRKEYWYFFLFYLLFYFAAAFIDGMFGAFDSEDGMALLTTVFALAMLLPSITVGVRRLHDTGRSGWWLLIALVPVLGALVLLFFSVQDSEPGDNRFGPNPKGLAVA